MSTTMVTNISVLTPPDEISPTTSDNSPNTRNHEGIIKISQHLHIGTLDDLWASSDSYNYQLIINLTSTYVDQTSMSSAQIINHPMNSRDFENLLCTVRQCLPLIDDAYNQKKSILICCRHGYSRACVLAITYFMFKYHHSSQKVYQQLKSIRDLSIDDKYWALLYKLDRLIGGFNQNNN